MWDFVYISVYRSTNIWFGKDGAFSGGGGYKLSETDDIATGRIMVYGTQLYIIQFTIQS